MKNELQTLAYHPGLDRWTHAIMGNGASYVRIDTLNGTNLCDYEVFLVKVTERIDNQINFIPLKFIDLPHTLS